MGARTLFFVLAALTIVLVVGVELATLTFVRNVAGGESVPGLGGPYLALLDGILLYLVVLMSIQHLPFKALTARVSSVVTLVLSFVGLFVTIGLIVFAFSLILLMLGLLMAAPFGTLAYLAVYADFPRSEAIAALTLVMLLKLFFLVMLALTDLGYLKNKGLMFLVGLSLLATWITSLLIAWPPPFLSSITDAVGALITAILALVMLVLIFVMSIVGVVRALRVRPAARQV
ncbi:MAG TPA: hypothetical protein VF339_11010 [Gammaproteobacteria bacterium]